jgi:3-oxoacyl-[acyl-carrier protein] reductase
MVRVAGRLARAGGGRLMDLGLEGRVALVTGGSKGIGLGIATALATEGARVAVASRTREAVEAAAEQIGGEGFVYDSDDLDAIPGLLDGVESALGPIDIYIANTGGPPPNPDPLGFTREQWEAAHRTLVLSPMTILQRLLPQMAERGWGRVVAVQSSAVLEPVPNLQLSNAHRPGVVASFKILAKQYAGDGITVNTVHPGRIATDRMIDTAGSREAAEAQARETIPAGRLGEPADMGAAAAFLCSEQAGYITGVSLLVDGGLTAGVY